MKTVKMREMRRHCWRRTSRREKIPAMKLDLPANRFLVKTFARKSSFMYGNAIARKTIALKQIEKEMPRGTQSRRKGFNPRKEKKSAQRKTKRRFATIET